MEKKELISVIVPIYNAKQYLERCVLSISKQSYKNLEIILVDDGSIDGSGQLCDSLKKKDDRIVVLHKKNGGEASARNTGMCIAKGIFLAFVDADDYVESDFILTLWEGMKEGRRDIAISSYVEEDGEERVLKEYCFPNESWCDGSGLLRFFRLEILGGVWNKLFSIEIIKKNKLEFAEDIKHGPDQLFIGEYLACTKSGVLLSKVDYHYIFVEDSISKKDFLSRKFERTRLSWIESAERLAKYVRLDEEEVREAFESFVAYRVQDTLLLHCLFHNQNTLLEKNLRQKIKERKKSWMASRSISRKGKLLMWLASYSFSMPFYRLLIFFYRRKLL